MKKKWSDMSFEEKFNTNVQKTNREIEDYVKFIPLISPILQEWQEVFDFPHVKADGSMIIALKEGMDFPPIACEFEKVGVIATFDNSRGFKYLELRLRK